MARLAPVSRHPLPGDSLCHHQSVTARIILATHDTVKLRLFTVLSSQFERDLDILFHDDSLLYSDPSVRAAIKPRSADS